MNQYKLTFTKVTRNKRIVEDSEYHIFDNINHCLNWLRRDLSVSCMPFFSIERVNNKLIKVFYNDKLMGDIEYYVEIKRVQLDISKQVKDMINHNMNSKVIMSLLRDKVEPKMLEDQLKYFGVVQTC